MSRTRSAMPAVLAVLGGWLLVLPSSALVIALRMRQLGESADATFYSLTIGLGWLLLVAALIGFGRLSDQLLVGRGSRRLLVVLALPVALAAGLWLALASSPVSLLLAWLLMQVPAAAIVAASMAIAGDVLPVNGRGLASGLVGASPIVTLLVGAFIVGRFADSLWLVFALLSALGIVLCLPLALGQSESDLRASTPANRDRRIPAPAVRWWATAWAVFLVADFLLSWTSSTTNGYVVLFVDYATHVPNADVGSVATGVVTIATVVAIAMSVLGGLLSRGRTSSAAVFALATIGVGASIAVLIAGDGLGSLYAGGILYGAGFGLANGAELALALSLRHAPDRLGRDLGVLSAVTSMPYILVPLVAAILLTAGEEAGLRRLFVSASALAFVGGVLALGIAVTNRRREGLT